MSVRVKIKQKPFEEAAARLNLSFTELAEELGVNRIYLSNVKNEKLPDFMPSPKLRRKMMEVLQVEFDDIFEITNHKPKKR